MLTKSESNERTLLLNDFDEENPSLDTLAILNRIEKQDELNKIYEMLCAYKSSSIDFWQHCKYDIYEAVTIGILETEEYVVSCLRYRIFPCLQNELLHLIDASNNKARHEQAMRFLILFGMLLTFFIMGIMFGISKGLNWINNKSLTRSLSQEDKDLLFGFLEKFGLANEITGITPVTDVMDLCAVAKEQIIKDKKMINERRFSFLIGRNDPGSTIPKDLPNDIAYKILHFSKLFSKAPVEMTAEECERKHLEFAV
ncbi:hypothetical protein [uncultured Legionella sp.]|uniref:hypothetical protein n=1 Tax=uncultured Legionella sp. TaxID=210934 RepID=UPI00260B45E1|nr:hypothetical protein [uncultured Legionella sp.]